MQSLTRHERKLLTAKNPQEYIDLSIRLNILPGRKAMVTRHWLRKKKKYTIEDIRHARNRHPHWKEKKMEGAEKRNRIRFKEHDYGTGADIVWDETRIAKFISSNRKDGHGNYRYRDWELARHFKCSIAAIQHMRRKYNMAVRILESLNTGVTDRRLAEYIRQSEKNLRRSIARKKR